ncbi:DUF3011 domain-containing protein [Luteimonas gilva]|uniref:DUF3011 domain-containing protein n=1 Tax=Luteimonas gilva TaxID=2572684 RepID=A0A4V5ZQH9_9GAMM|nr:DUF3011 domain-containing protein [Luteimonas gilva]TKR33143.1 DUF3011 domain-containing protein [Luteimonas gilva]
MRHMLYCCVLLLAAPMVGAGEARAQSGSKLDEYRERLPSDVIRCESEEGRTRQCTAETNGSVKLLRQLSDSACTEGQTWGYSRNGVWVTQGCRGEFAVGFGAKSAAGRDVMRCESADGRWHLCPLKAPGQVELIKQLSRSPCIRDMSWGRDNRGVWVAQGCRGEFRVAGGVRSEAEDTRYGQGPDFVRCESKGGNERRCPVAVGESVRMVRQLSNSACIQDQSWGWDREGVWVRSGCRAEFEVR